MSTSHQPAKWHYKVHSMQMGFRYLRNKQTCKVKIWYQKLLNYSALILIHYSFIQQNFTISK